MFQPQPKSKLQIEIDKLVLALGDHKPDSKEYGIIANRLSQLEKIQNDNRPDRPTWNTGLTIGANLLGILLILQYEHLHPVVSKALPFVKKV